MQQRVPLYEQIREDLKQQILDPASKLTKLSESGIIAQYQVSATTARRVLNELEEAGLVDRQRGAGSFVRQPQQKQVKELGVVFFHVFDPDELQVAQVVEGIERRARDQQHSLHLYTVRGRSIADAWDGVLGHLLARRKIDGLFILSPLPTEDVRFLVRQHVPLVAVSNVYPELQVPSVMIDYGTAVAEAAASLRRAGCFRLALLTGPAGEGGVHRAHELAVEGFRRFHEASGMDYLPDYVQPLAHAAEPVERAMSAFARMDERRRPDGIIAMTSAASWAAHRFLSEHEHWHPRLIGFTHEEPRYPSEVTISYRELGEKAFEMLDHYMLSPSSPPASHFMRISTASPTEALT